MDRRLVFVVEGSKGDEYEIIAERISGRLTVSCTCDGALNGTHCRHRVGLLQGDVKSLLSENEDEVALLPSMLTGTALAAALERYCEADKACQAAQERLKSAKRALARVMIRGA